MQRRPRSETRTVLSVFGAAPLMRGVRSLACVSTGYNPVEMISLKLPVQAATGYKSASQIARVTTEAWAASNLYCPNCESPLIACPANTRTKDFDCASCGEQFQLKSLTGNLNGKLLGAAYKTTLASIEAEQHPSLILLRYSRPDMIVVDVRFVHRACITKSCLVARNPLGPNARRARWQGSIIVLDQIPETAKIDVVRAGVISPAKNICRQWQIAQQMLKQNLESRGWTADILKFLEQLQSKFILQDVYRFEDDLGKLHPGNNYIRAKIRQQLQVLRDLGLISFENRGEYRKL
jgi:type II restriction enzyme